MRVLIISLFIAVFLPGSVLGQANPHPVTVSPIVYSDETTVPLGGDIHFLSYITERPAETLNESSLGAVVWDGGLQFDISAFATAWAPGETLVIEIRADGSNYAGPEGEDIILIITSGGSQSIDAVLEPLSGETVILVPLFYSDGITPMLVEDASITAFITTRPTEVVSGDSTTGNVIHHAWGTAVRVDKEEFLTPWSAGEILSLTVDGEGSNYTGPESFDAVVTLTTDVFTWMTRLSAD